MYRRLIARNCFLYKNSPLFVSSNQSKQFYSNYKNDPILSKTTTYTNKKLSFAHSVSPLHLLPDTFNDLIEKSAANRGSELAYVFPHNGGLRFTFAELKQRVNLMAQNFLALGFQKGDRIALILPNTHELVISALAAASIGLISVLLNPGYQLVEVEYMLKKVGCKGVVAYDSFKVLNHLEILKNICPEMEHSAPGELKSAKLPDLKHVIILNTPLNKTKQTYKGTWDYSQLAKGPLTTNKSYEKPYLESDDPAFILFTVNIIF